MSILRRTRPSLLPLWTVFFVNGAVLASWAPRIPEVSSRLSLSNAQLGWALLAVAAGSIPALAITARLLRFVAPKPLCIGAAIAFPAALPLLALASNVRLLAGALLVLGAVSGCLDVAMNTAAIRYQKTIGARVLSRLHSGYSLGVLAGAGSGAIAAAFDVTVLAHFIMVGISLTTLAVVVSTALPGSAPGSESRDARTTTERSQAPRPRASVIPASIGAMAVAALLIEGMVTDWSALLVSRDFGGGATVGAAAVVAFSSAMFLSRSIGDVIVDRLGAARTVSVSAATVAAASAAGLLVQHHAWVAVAVVAIIGAAVGPLFPLLITEAGSRSRAGVAAATARISVIGYGAYLGGPPMVGFLADHVGLPIAFVGVALACAAVLATMSMTVRAVNERT